MSRTRECIFTAGNLNPIAQLEPTRYILTVEDPNRPPDTRFLHVLQGADAGTAMVSASCAKSTSGIAFEGTVFGTTAVYFPVNVISTFSGTALPVPPGIRTVVITGLMPKFAYGVVTQPGPAGRVAIITPGVAGAVADSAGVLTLSF